MTGKLPPWAERVRALRKARGMTIRALAESSKLGHASIERLERGEAPSLRTMDTLAKALGVSLAEFFEAGK